MTEGASGGRGPSNKDRRAAAGGPSLQGHCHGLPQAHTSGDPPAAPSSGGGKALPKPAHEGRNSAGHCYPEGPSGAFPRPGQLGGFPPAPLHARAASVLPLPEVWPPQGQLPASPSMRRLQRRPRNGAVSGQTQGQGSSDLPLPQLLRETPCLAPQLSSQNTEGPARAGETGSMGAEPTGRQPHSCPSWYFHMGATAPPHGAELSSTRGRIPSSANHAELASVQQFSSPSTTCCHPGRHLRGGTPPKLTAAARTSRGHLQPPPGPHSAGAHPHHQRAPHLSEGDCRGHSHWYKGKPRNHMPHSPCRYCNRQHHKSGFDREAEKRSDQRPSAYSQAPTPHRNYQTLTAEGNSADSEGTAPIHCCLTPAGSSASLPSPSTRASAGTSGSRHGGRGPALRPGQQPPTSQDTRADPAYLRLVQWNCLGIRRKLPLLQERLLPGINPTSSSCRRLYSLTIPPFGFLDTPPTSSLMNVETHEVVPYLFRITSPTPSVAPCLFVDEVLRSKVLCYTWHQPH